LEKSVWLCTARTLAGDLARRRRLAATIYSAEAELASVGPIDTTLAAQFSTVDGAELFTSKLKVALAPAVVTPAWNVIPDLPITFYQMELQRPSFGIYGLDGTFVLQFTVPNTYVDGNLVLTFTSIAVGSVPRLHTYAVPFISDTRTEFRKVIETKNHITAPLDDGTYNLFVNYTMRKYS
jgi:hypothetical protein